LKKIFAVLLVLATGTAAAGEIDKRRILPLTEPQRDHVLTEMRALLSGTQNILSALSREDMVAVADHARSLGMGMAHKGEDHLKAVLPREFMQLGMSVHKAFDQIAVDAESLKDPKHTLRQLSESMKKCIACHDSYQIRIKELPADSGAQASHHPHH
jgi:chemotaxis signal transduction protein